MCAHPTRPSHPPVDSTHAEEQPSLPQVCADTFRAGAFDQLKQNATKLRVPFYGPSFCSVFFWGCIYPYSSPPNTHTHIHTTHHTHMYVHIFTHTNTTIRPIQAPTPRPTPCASRRRAWRNSGRSTTR